MLAGLLLLAGLARAEETVEYDRLFGPAPEAPAAAAPAAAPPEIPAWAWPAALATVGGALLLRKRVLQKAGVAATPIRVLSRQPLGDRATLVLIDVVDADGERRRLLVGTGGGAPTLVTDLGTVPPDAPDAPADGDAGGPPVNVAEEILAERARAGAFEREATRRGIRA